MYLTFDDCKRAIGGDDDSGSGFLGIIQICAMLENAEREVIRMAQQISTLSDEIRRVNGRSRLIEECDGEISVDFRIKASGTALEIVFQCEEVAEMLIEKNRKYGDSAVNPVRVFSKCDSIEQLNVRMDDKLSRIMSAQADDAEDAELDLIGYLILKRVAKRLQA